MRRYHVFGTRTIGTDTRSFSYPVLADSYDRAYDAVTEAVWQATKDGATYVFRVEEESCQFSRLAS